MNIEDLFTSAKIRRVEKIIKPVWGDFDDHVHFLGGKKPMKATTG